MLIGSVYQYQSVYHEKKEINLHIGFCGLRLAMYQKISVALRLAIKSCIIG